MHISTRVALVIAVITAIASVAHGQNADDARKDEARVHFEQGLGHFQRDEYGAALAEFLKARELFPSRGATKNAAICLRKEGRYDESLEMFEKLVVEFPDLSASDKQLVDKEIEELRASIGAVEIEALSGAMVVIDARERGKTPTSPLRVGAGSHVVRVVKEGFVPFEQRFDLAGHQLLTIRATMQALTRSGRLSVVEKSGKAVAVFVDNLEVGKTPWQGALAPGTHSVFLREGSSAGTQPAAAPIRLDETTTLTLEVVPTDATLRLDPTPASALVALDGVTLGRGVWEGKVPAGEHRVEVTDDGFVLSRRTLTVGKERVVVRVALERDFTSPLWAKKHPSHFFAELSVGPAFGFMGGDVEQGCASPCSAGVTAGVRPVLRGGYELASGVGVSLDAGALYAWRSITSRSTKLVAVGGFVEPGTASDWNALGGVTLGGSISFHRGDVIALTGRLGVGVLIGVASVHRDGSFTNTAGEPFNASLRDTFGTSFLYVAPEVRVAYRFGAHAELSIGVEGLLMATLAVPRWKDQSQGAPNVVVAKDGLASSPPGESIAGNIVAFVSPTAAVRVDF